MAAMMQLQAKIHPLRKPNGNISALVANDYTELLLIIFMLIIVVCW